MAGCQRGLILSMLATHGTQAMLPTDNNGRQTAKMLGRRMDWRYKQPHPSIIDNGAGIFIINLSDAHSINSSSLCVWTV